MKRIFTVIFLLFAGYYASGQNWNLRSSWTTWGYSERSWLPFDFNPANPDKGVTNRNGFIYTTTDGGNTWDTVQGTPTIQSQMCTMRYISSNKLLMGESGKIYKSTDDGASFSLLKDTTGADIFQIEGKGNLVLIGCRYGYVIRSKEQGNTFLPKQKIFPTSVNTQVKVVNESFGYCYSKDGIKYTADLGDTWTDLKTDSIYFESQGERQYFTLPHSTLWDYLVTAKNKNEWFIQVGFNNKKYLFRTFDAGENWENITESLKGVCHDHPAFSQELRLIDCSTDGQIFSTFRVGNKHNRIVYSPDFGTQLECDTVDAPGTYFPDDLNMGFRQIGNRMFLLCYGTDGDNRRIYTKEVGNDNNTGISTPTVQRERFSIRPTVSDGVFQIENPAGLNVHYSIFDISGKNVFNITTRNTSETVQLSLNKGLYFISNSQTGQTEKMIIK